jgi:hypothetical protein
MKNYLLTLSLLLYMLPVLQAQRKWTGAIDGYWNNPLNWQPSGIPAISDEVVLDNSEYKMDYAVTLPAGTVTIASLLISPALGQVIKLLLPTINISSPALVLTNLGDALILNKGGIFQNASGLTSGQSLKIAGNIRINNGGVYIHNTRSAHANDIVAKLSVAEGTEEGVFEFDVPSASSTISLSNRSFGKLKLSSASYNGNVSYSGAGSNPVNIRSDLEIGERVSFSIGFSNVFSIKRNLLQNGGSFNISNDNNATIVAVAGNLLQSAGQITETGGATPVLLLNGAAKQELQFAAGILNDIIVRMDNGQGAELRTPLIIPYRLELRNGKIKNSPATPITLLTNATLQADSLSKSFVDGPFRKEGLNNSPQFLFPVGKAGNQRWLELKNATGNFTVSYIQQNPYDLSTVMDDGLDHISSIESWTIDADALPASSAQLELSFDNVHSGGVSDVSTLRVAALVSGIKWSNRGNKGVTGSAGSAGSVISEMIYDFSAEKRLFTLGSSVSNHNTLPDIGIIFTGKNEGLGVRFEWQTSTDLPITSFVIESASNGIPFHAVKTILNQPGDGRFTCFYYDDKHDEYFRLKIMLKDAAPSYSKVIFVPGKDAFTIIAASQLNSELKLRLHSTAKQPLLSELYDVAGRLLWKRRETITNGETLLAVPLLHLKSGLYYLNIITNRERLVTAFFKR